MGPVYVLKRVREPAVLMDYAALEASNAVMESAPA